MSIKTIKEKIRLDVHDIENDIEVGAEVVEKWFVRTILDRYTANTVLNPVVGPVEPVIVDPITVEPVEPDNHSKQVAVDPVLNSTE